MRQDNLREFRENTTIECCFCSFIALLAGLSTGVGVYIALQNAMLSEGWKLAMSAFLGGVGTATGAGVFALCTSLRNRCCVAADSNAKKPLLN